MEKNFKEKLEEQEIIKKIENSQTLEKGKQGVFSVLYGRTIVVFLLLLIQILIMIFGVMRLAEAWYAFAVTMTALGVILVIYLINKPENPAYKISWIVMILALPVFGAALYLFVESQPANRRTNARLVELHKEMREFCKQDPGVREHLAQLRHLESSVDIFIYRRQAEALIRNTFKESNVYILTKIGRAHV